MRRHGHTAKGTPRWYCPACKTSGVRRRPDTAKRHMRQRLIRWLTGKMSLCEMAREHRMTRRGLSKQFRPSFAVIPAVPTPQATRILVVDGVSIHGRSLVALIARTERGEISWDFAPRENALAWQAFLARLPHPEAVVCDGHAGILKALRVLWPDAAIQRCHFHIAQGARRYLTRRPRTEAGREARALVALIPRMRTHEAARGWHDAWRAWEERHTAVLSERTRYTDGVRIRWWYTHRNLRGIRSLIREARAHLFTYLDHPGTPNTTNHVEGGINAMIAEAMRLHRGLRIHQKKTLVSLLLAEWNQRKNATRKFS